MYYMLLHIVVYLELGINYKAFFLEEDFTYFCSMAVAITNR